MRQTDGETTRRETKIAPSPRPFVSSSLICAACGAEARRESASFCLVCGKSLDEDYQPLDALRASYNLQGKSFAVEEKTEELDLFERNENSISQTAYACLVYSFVPYLGILFVPFTLGIGGYAYFAALQQPHLGGRKLALMNIGLSFVVLAMQIFLWWLLYVIPELGR
ncbi:MAG TPA: hypothetical protein PKE69_09800 [Pyrinomonadaceae bacterium]|nr:hypothetical protein [Pyrinomonadaceae bacterium]